MRAPRWKCHSTNGAHVAAHPSIAGSDTEAYDEANAEADAEADVEANVEADAEADARLKLTAKMGLNVMPKMALKLETFSMAITVRGCTSSCTHIRSYE